MITLEMIEKLSKNNFDTLTRKAAGLIKSGGIVILPFDTVYGFACDPKNNETIEYIYELKGRDYKKPLGIAVSNFETLSSLGKLSIESRNFIKGKIPGPYTFIVRLKEPALISKYCQLNGTCGIRIPDSPLILDIAKFTGGIAQTSANKSGEGNCYSIEEFISQYSKQELEKIDLIIDGGEIERKGASEIIDLSGKSPTSIERK